MKPLRVAVDFDGTLHDPSNKRPGYKMGTPIPGAVSGMRELKKFGAILVIHSIWADTEQKCQTMAEWLRYFDIPFDFITNKKPDVDYYVDDKGYHFENWFQTVKDLTKDRTAEPEA